MSLPLRSNYTLLAVLIGALVALSGCGGNGDEQGQGGPPGMQASIPSVEVVQSRTGSLPLEQRLSGTVRARNQVTIYPEISGRIESVHVENGDFVQRGQVLARLNSRVYEEQVRQAEADLKVQQASAEQTAAQLRQLEAELSTTEQLAAGEYASQLELEQLRAQVEGARADHNRALAVVEQAESTLDERREALSETVIRAPVSGRVGNRVAEQGMQVDTNSQLFEVGDPSDMRVEVRLTERMMEYINEGQRALVHAERLGDNPIDAEVGRISPFLEQSTFSTTATLDVDNSDGRLTSGMYVEVEILYGESEEAILVPNSALHENPQTGTMGVFLAPNINGKSAWQVHDRDGEKTYSISDPMEIEYREVEVIASGRSTSGISGIEPGNWIVAVGQGMIDLNEASEGRSQARTRPVSWERLLDLQNLQERDLLRQFMERHQQITRDRADTVSDEEEGRPSNV